MVKVATPIWLSLAFLIFTNSSCSLIGVDEVEIAERDTELAIPVLITSFSIKDIFEKYINSGNLQIDAENFVTLFYESETLTGTSDTLVQIEDFQLPVVDNEMEIAPENFDFEYRLQRIDLKTGQMAYNAQNPFPETVNVNLTLFDIHKNGVPINLEFSITGFGAEATGMLNLSNYEIDLSEDFSIQYSAFTASGEEVVLPLILLEFQNLEFKYLEGNFEGLVLSLPKDSLFYEILEDLNGGEFFLENPKLTMNFSNAYGIPLRLVADTFQTETRNAGLFDFQTPLNSGFDFAYPNLNEVGNFAHSNLEINNQNSNLPEIISALPFRFDYQFDALAFPENDTTTIGFITDNGEFKVDMKFELPLFGRAKGLAFEDTFEFKGQDLEDVKTAELKLVAQNAIPAELGLELVFEDDNGEVLETLLDANDLIFASAQIDENGNSTGAIDSEKLIPIPEDKISKMQKSTKVRMKIFLSTLKEGSEPIRVKTDYKIAMQVGLKVIPE